MRVSLCHGDLFCLTPVRPRESGKRVGRGGLDIARPGPAVGGPRRGAHGLCPTAYGGGKCERGNHLTVCRTAPWAPPFHSHIPAHPTPTPSNPMPGRIHDGKDSGIVVRGFGSKGRLEGCNIVRNLEAGLVVTRGADPLVTNCRCAGGVRSGVYSSLFGPSCRIHELSYAGGPCAGRGCGAHAHRALRSMCGCIHTRARASVPSRFSTPRGRADCGGRTRARLTGCPSAQGRPAQGRPGDDRRSLNLV